MLWIILCCVCLAIGLAGLYSLLYLEIGTLRKRLENADARIVRLEQVEDRRHGFDQAMEEQKDPNIIRLRCKPDPSCKKCHGRGTIGKNTKTGLFIPCTCCC